MRCAPNEILRGLCIFTILRCHCAVGWTLNLNSDVINSAPACTKPARDWGLRLQNYLYMLAFVVSMHVYFAYRRSKSTSTYSYTENERRENEPSTRREWAGLIMQHDMETTHAEHQSPRAHPTPHLLIHPPFSSLCSFAFKIKNYTKTVCINEHSNGMPGSGLVVPVNKITRIFKWLRKWEKEKWNLAPYRYNYRKHEVFLGFFFGFSGKSDSEPRSQFIPWTGVCWSEAECFLFLKLYYVCPGGL